jgi:hypothetical protein
VAGSASGVINTPDVNIYLSTDGGYTFADTIAMHVANVGSYSFHLPAWITNTPDTFHIDKARIMIEGDGNIFFDISNHDFRIDTLDILEPLDSSFVIKFINLNIVTDDITFKLTAPMDGQFVITISDAAGRLVRNINFDKTSQLVEKTLDVSDLAGGLYIIRFDGPDFTQKKKFVKTKLKS